MASLNVCAEGFLCPVCHEIFKVPVLLSCGHSVCKKCVQQFWRTMKTQKCPVCRRTSLKTNPPIHNAVKNLCELFLKERNESRSSESEEVCSLHSEKFKLFCLDDKEVACLVCKFSQKHDKHTLGHISEVVPVYKEEINIALKSLKEELKFYKKMKEETEKAIMSQNDHKVDRIKQIKQQFEELHQFLRDKEAATITALREEQEQKICMYEKKLHKF